MLIASLGARAQESVPSPGLSSSVPAALVVDRKRAETERPFWRKPAVMQKIREDRAIVVSVRREDAPNEQVRFLMSGAGMVTRPKEFCFGISQHYAKLKEISDHFKTVNYDSSQRQLFLVTEALGYQARMVLKILPVSEDWRSELQWEVIWGHFKGMTGLIGFERITEKQTEMSLSAKYEAAELPLPRILMGFALEVVTQKVAERMRAFIESQPANALESDQDPRSSLKVPKGFSISLFAKDVPNARQMALSPRGTLFVGTRKGEVFAIDGAADSAAKGEVARPARVIAKDLNEPNGVAFHNGSLYVGEISRILRFDHAEAPAGEIAKPFVVRDDYPTDRHHGWKYIAIGPDGWLYVPVGAPCNVCKKGGLYASLTRLSLDGKKREIFASGIRNTVGFDWHPKTKELWFTDNGRDNLGDEIPDDELNRVPKAGLNFGFPFCHAGDVADPEHGGKANCRKNGPYQAPEAKLGAHVAALGMKFYGGKMFPDDYRGRVFIAQHGSWNRSKKVGYRVVSVPLKAGGSAGAPEVFADGWLENESVSGRPVDILVMPDGSMLVSDDMAGVIYRIAFRG